MFTYILLCKNVIKLVEVGSNLLYSADREGQNSCWLKGE